MNLSQNASGKNQTNTNESSTVTIKPNKALLVLVVLVSFALLIVLMMFSGNQSSLALDENKLLVMQHAKVEVMPIEIVSNFTRPRLVYGQVEALQQSDLGFELSGTLSQLMALEGDYVKKGQVLAVLDIARLNARQNELESALNSAQANATLANISAQRVIKLVAKNLETQQRLDEGKAQVDALNALASEAQARLDSLKVELAKSKLVAPFDGQIVRQYIDMGTVVNPGLAVFSILENDELEVRFGLPEQTAFGIKPLQTHMLHIGGQTIPAQVKSVASQRNLATRTIDAVFSIDSSALSIQQKASMITGDLVSFSVETPIQAQGTWVPISALASGVRGLWSLYIVDENETIQTRLVSVIYANETKAFVSGAVNQGEHLVISGIHRLVPNQLVDNVNIVDSPLAYTRPLHAN